MVEDNAGSSPRSERIAKGILAGIVIIVGAVVLVVVSYVFKVLLWKLVGGGD